MYYESHITVEPVFDERLDRFSELCDGRGFRPAKLMMKKRKRTHPNVASTIRSARVETRTSMPWPLACTLSCKTCRTTVSPSGATR